MDSVEVELFSEGSQFFFTSAGTLFSSSAEFEVFLRIRRNDFAEEFSKFCCVFSFFKSDAFCRLQKLPDSPDGQQHGS